MVVGSAFRGRGAFSRHEVDGQGRGGKIGGGRPRTVGWNKVQRQAKSPPCYLVSRVQRGGSLNASLNRLSITVWNLRLGLVHAPSFGEFGTGACAKPGRGCSIASFPSPPAPPRTAEKSMDWFGSFAWLLTPNQRQTTNPTNFAQLRTLGPVCPLPRLAGTIRCDAATLGWSSPLPNSHHSFPLSLYQESWRHVRCDFGPDGAWRGAALSASSRIRLRRAAGTRSR